MAWPKGKSRKRQVVAIDPASADGDQSVEVTASMQDGIITIESVRTIEPEPPQYPADWHPGQLLNVRNTGPDYTITLWPEEADPRKPERALHFTNPGHAQNFVSAWYSRQSHDPRAR